MHPSGNHHRYRFAAVLLACCALACPAGAVLIDFGDGTGNTSAPADDPGFDNVGDRSGLSAVYLGDGWVLGVAHAFVGPTIWLGTSYDPINGTFTRLKDGSGNFSDLIVWGVWPHPPLPSLTVRSLTSLPSGEVVMIGHGRDRGAATDTDDTGAYLPPPVLNPAIDGFYWDSPRSFRWGTNKVTAAWPGNPFDTVTFYTTLDKNGPGRTTYEAQAVLGDSGGGVFSKETGSWELAGLMFVTGTLPGDPGTPGSGQQSSTSFHTNITGIVDLSFYYDDIMDLTAIPEPTGGSMLAAGLAFLLAVGRKRSR